MPPPTAHMPSEADPTPSSLFKITHALFVHPSLLSCLMGSYIHWVLLFAWVLLFKKRIATEFMGTYNSRVLVFDGYLYSRVYGIVGSHQSSCGIRTTNSWVVSPVL